MALDVLLDIGASLGINIGGLAIATRLLAVTIVYICLDTALTTRQFRGRLLCLVVAAKSFKRGRFAACCCDLSDDCSPLFEPTEGPESGTGVECGGE